jgi:class 3 adenylate cyclase/pimeloyl-ACP methyl ester carboxylesterase
VRIAYALQGEGPPLFVCPAFVESFSLEHLFPAEAAFWAAVAKHHRLIRFDLRGTGHSQRNLDQYSMEGVCLDMEAVVRAAGFKRVAVWAARAAGPYAIRFAATRKRLVSGLILYGASASGSSPFGVDATLAFATLWRTNPAVAAQALADLGSREAFPEVGAQTGAVLFQSVSGEDAARIFEAAAQPESNTEPYLSKITAPTLVMHVRTDGVYPYATAQSIAAGIKHARFLPLDSADGHYAIGDTAPVIDALLEFLRPTDTAAPKVETPSPPPGSFRTILFTDLVGHTEMMRRLGDDRGREVLREHERITRDLLKQHGGAEVKTMGDGFMASFASVTKAMDCAIALQRAFASHEGEPLQVRVVLNAGEPIEEDGDLFGSTVIMASRIAAKAGAGEILIPEPVRHLLSGKGFVFADRGEFVPKGFDDAVRLYDVRWREDA